MRRAPDAPGGSGRTGSPALQAFAFLTDRRGTGNDTDSNEEASGPLAPPRNSSRRNRIDDLEEMMMMEAIRLSLASEDERRKREEKEIKKESKRREKEAKKAEKAARKTGLYSNNASSSALDVPTGLGRVISSSSSITGEEASPGGKGKEVERVSSEPSGAASAAAAAAATESSNPTHNSFVTAESQPSAVQSSPREPARPSHLRHVSSASSFSSLVESMSEDHAGASDANSSAPEPMFNFRSLAAVIGDEEKKEECAEHVEDATFNPTAEGSTSRASELARSQSEDRDVSAAEKAKPEAAVEEDSGHLISKELETRSVEITGTAGNTEATS